jgi:hypothetical protein
MDGRKPWRLTLTVYQADQDTLIGDSKLNTTTPQLGIAYYNMGNLCRPSHLRDESGTYTRHMDHNKYDFRYNMLIKLLNRSPGTLIGVCEAEGLHTDRVRGLMPEWQLVSSHDTNLCLGVRGPKGNSSIKILVDTTSGKESVRAQRDFSDDPAGWNAHKDTTLWYMIAEVQFGKNAFNHLKFPITLPNGEKKTKPEHWGTEVLHGHPCTRATLPTVRILVFHVDHDSANKSCNKTRQRLRQMALDIAKYQVDFAGGDANGSLYKYYKSDEENIGQLSIKHSSLMMTIQAMVDAVNKVCSPLHGGKVPLAYQAVTATTWANLEAINDWFQKTPAERKDMTYPDQDVICMIAFSWGHTKWADSSRQQCQAYLEQSGRDVAVGST